MLPAMKLLLDSLWRAAAYCLLPRVIWLSFLPLLLCAGAAALLGYFYWEPATAAVSQQLQDWALTRSALQWLESMSLGSLAGVLAPLIVVTLAVPVIVIVCLLSVAQLMLPTFARLVHERRFPKMVALGRESWLLSLLRGIGWTFVALLALLVSLPLWLVPPLILVLPPVIWGWLSYRVMTPDVLVERATSDELRAILREHRWQLWGIGLVSGYLGAAPSLLWALGAVTLVFAPFIIVASVWLYTLIFAFSALWFAHYALAALQIMRGQQLVEVVAAEPVDDAPALPRAATEPLAELPAPPHPPAQP